MNMKKRVKREGNKDENHHDTSVVDNIVQITIFVNTLLLDSLFSIYNQYILLIKC